MDKKPFLKLLKYFDDQFIVEREYEDDLDGYESLFLKSPYFNEYLDLVDFIEYNSNGLNYNSWESLIYQYSEINQEQRIGIIEVFFNLVYFSDVEDSYKSKVAGYLNRYRIVFNDDNKYKKAMLNVQNDFLEGSYGRIYLIDEKLVKKQLKLEYWDDNDISSRFKHEYYVQKKMNELGGQVLSVYDYDDITKSYIMERADMDLYDLVDETILKFEDKTKIILEIVNTIKIAHNNNIIHRDLHPGNIMIMGNSIFITDFGFAKDYENLRSKLSTVQPKPNHIFIAPEGITDFTSLDKISDIYSLGKLIDFIMGNGKFTQSHPYNTIVQKATSNSKDNRHNNIESLYDDLVSVLNYLKKGDSHDEIYKYIEDGVHNVVVEETVVNLANKNKLSDQIVANQWNEISEIILKCDYSNQIKIMNSIRFNFIEATGYKGWVNYDLFADISYKLIFNSNYQEIKLIALNILSECAKVRFHANDLIESVPIELIEQLRSN